jgi:aminotransferase
MAGIEEKLSKRTHAVQWSGIRVMFALAEEVEGIVNLGIGQPSFDTPSFIREAAKRALDEGYTRYPPARGFMDLRQAISTKLRAENGFEADPSDEIFVAVGAMQGIFNAILHLVDPGDEVLVMDPGYDYYSQIGLFGGIAVPVAVRESNGFRVDPDDIRRAITNKTKMMIVNSPSNPTGALIDRPCLEEIARIARKHGILVLSDEPYERIVFEGKEHVSIASLEGMKELTVSVYTLSKTYAMTGWRVGYVAGPKPVIDEMEKIMEHQVSGVTAFAQRAALAAIQGPQGCVDEMVAHYEAARRCAWEGLNAIDRVTCLKPDATFYAFPNISRTGMSSWDLAKYLAREHGVAVIPGSVFGRGGEGYVRVSFAADLPTLREGIARMRKGIESLKG